MGPFDASVGMFPTLVSGRTRTDPPRRIERLCCIERDARTRSVPVQCGIWSARWSYVGDRRVAARPWAMQIQRVVVDSPLTYRSKNVRTASLTANIHDFDVTHLRRVRYGYRLSSDTITPRIPEHSDAAALSRPIAIPVVTWRSRGQTADVSRPFEAGTGRFAGDHAIQGQPAVAHRTSRSRPERGRSTPGVNRYTPTQSADSVGVYTSGGGPSIRGCTARA
jgi:hypothetical protein